MTTITEQLAFDRMRDVINNRWEVQYLNQDVAPHNGYVHYDERIQLLVGLIEDRIETLGNNHALYGYSTQTPLEERLADAIHKHR